jgi:signal transduction histidine kinase
VTPTKPYAAIVAEAALRTGDHTRAVALLTMLRLHWFIRLRWVFLIVAAGLLTADRLVVKDSSWPLPALAITLSGLACANLLWIGMSYLLFRRVREDDSSSGRSLGPVEIFANAQVAVDLFLLTCILRLTGGVENPAAIFYLFHMAIVALLLQRWQAILQGVWALLLYAILVVGEWQQWLTPHFGFVPGLPIDLHTNPKVVFSSLLVVACGIFGTLYFTLRIAGRLERRERDLRETNVALRESQLAIEELQRRRSRFMQASAHQLKSPLATIQTLAELIRGNVVPAETMPETCDKIIRHCKEGIAQVSELITLARVQEADPARHKRSSADVRAVVSDLCERFQPLARERDLSLTCQLPAAADLFVNVDQRDLRDCVGNLIENAIKYTPGPGSVTVTATLQSPSAGFDAVSIEVRDTGIGVAPELLALTDGDHRHEKAFEAFCRGNNALDAGIPGTGLGLAIVREIAGQAGAQIRVTSRPKEGSSFTITFPADSQPAPRVRTPGALANEAAEPHSPAH